MSSAIAGVNLPANVVTLMRLLLGAVEQAGTPELVVVRLSEVYGSLITLEHLQRLSQANATRLYQHADALAAGRERALGLEAMPAHPPVEG